MESLIRAQTDTQNNIERSKVNYKKTGRDRRTATHLQTRLDNLERDWALFCNTHRQILSKVDSRALDDLQYMKEDMYGAVEELYIDFKSELKEKLSSKQSSTAVAPSTPGLGKSSDGSTNNIKLPKISIPNFSGKYDEWITFRDLFDSLIRKNKSLDDVQKLHYLKGYLTGEAEQLLRHIPITKDNFEVCWKQLESRYDNKKYLANCVLKRFFGQKNLQSESASAIKEMLDTTNECLHALENLGVDISSWDIIVIYIICLKLDSETRKLWEAKINDSSTSNLPKLVNFKEFLEQRFRSLEFLDTKSSNKPKQYTNQNTTTRALHATENTVTCLYCKETHKITNCKSFAKEDVETRREFVQTNRLCFNCLGANYPVFSCRLATRCRVCHKKHHSLLHTKAPQGLSESNEVEKSVTGVTSMNITTSVPDDSVNMVSCFTNLQSQVLLATALVQVESPAGTLVLRSLLDQGSQASLITEAAVQLLRLKKMPSKCLVSGIGSDKKPSCASNYVVVFKLQSLHEPSFEIDVKAHVLSKVTSFIPDHQVKLGLWSELSKVMLADPAFETPNKIDVLLGAEVYGQIIVDGIIRGPPGTPLAQNTKLGWILSGQVSNECSDNTLCHTISVVSNHAQTSDDDLLKRFWELESDHSQMGTKEVLTEEEQKCEQFFTDTVSRDESGRYIVKLPFRDDDPQCRYGELQKIATKRFMLLEKRLLKDPKLRAEYAKVIHEYVELGHMEEVPEDQRYRVDAVYLPHHAVVREDKTTTKVRVVFDASCLGTNGVSLNMDMMVGPTLQSDLRHIIMQWRRHPICLVADIVKMYRQVKVSESDADAFQRLLWRDDPNSTLQHYRMLRVTFGTASAPYLAVRTLQQVAREEGEMWPVAAEKVLKDFYMDDLMSGCQSVSEGFKIYEDMTALLRRGGFELQKWSTNNDELLKMIGVKERTDFELEFDKVMKVLGLRWNRRSDEFEYFVQLPPLSTPITKRKVISDIAKLFDPCGYIAPVIIVAKIFIQKIWMTGILWDEELPKSLLQDYLRYRDELSQLSAFSIPRWMSTKDTDLRVELHGFSDASSEAFAAAVYIRVIDQTGNVHVNLVTAKTKVAPIKQISIPRSELCGAVLVTNLLMEVAEVLGIPKTNIHAWTDSQVVLAWLRGHPSKWKTFIANRVSEIFMVLEVSQWSHVKSKDNPADCASRGVKPADLIKFELWKHGPTWLRDSGIKYSFPEVPETDLEVKTKCVKSCVTTSQEEDEVWSRFSSFRRLTRVVAWCKRFISRCRNESKSFPAWLTTIELSDAEESCVKKCQIIHFSEEIENLSKKKPISKKSRIVTLNPFIDSKGFLRVGGRLNNAEGNENFKHPIVMPRKSMIVDLLIADAHDRTLHGGPQLMQNYLRTKFWILDIKNLVRFYVRKCVRCIRFSAKTTNQLMGQLPSPRVIACRPFLQSGVDYAGPISIRTSKGRGQHAYKGYICLFVCMTTRAIHLEVVSDLTSQGFLAAFKRFVSRRGHCADMWSDNGTNFVGAARELRELFAHEKSSVVADVAEQLAANGTNWHFIPPHAPNFGGLWEAGVKSTKHHLRRVVGNTTLTFEELSTVLAQIEACLNSRPICQVSSSASDPSPLTPGHFLIGEPPVLVPETSYEQSNLGTLKRWQLVQRMTQDFWRRWSGEYLCQFMNRYKWAYQQPEPKIGDIVLVKEDDMPPAHWLYGIITKKHTGSDNLTRVVSLRCKGGIMKRPVSKLCILPVSD